MKNKKKVLIVTPYLDSVGGTELETINTAKKIFGTGNYFEVEIFTPHKLDKELFISQVANENIVFKRYPSFFYNRFVSRIAKKIGTLTGTTGSFLEQIFWKFRQKKNFSLVYIITQTSYNYYYPLISHFPESKIIVRNTGVNRRPMPPHKKTFLKSIYLNIVTSVEQKDFFVNKLGIENTINEEVLINNEEKLLDVKNQTKLYTFGILTRFSREKNLEAAILLVEGIVEKEFEVKLIIAGKGDSTYYEELKTLIRNKRLGNHIKIAYEWISPLEVNEFYEKISYFLVTSNFEGGPTTALEAMAAGVPVLSLRVGAMENRLTAFPQLLADDINDMISKAIHLLDQPNEVYEELSSAIRGEYVRSYANSYKLLGFLYK